jgi:hypothetical protein
VPLQGLAQEPLRGSELSSFAEPELDRVTVAVDGLTQIPPLVTHLYISLVDMPPTGDRSPTLIELLQQERDIVDRSAMDHGMIDGDARSAIIASRFRKLRL